MTSVAPGCTDLLRTSQTSEGKQTSFLLEENTVQSSLACMKSSTHAHFGENIQGFFQIKGVCAGTKMLPITAKCTKSAKEAPGDITKETRRELTDAIFSSNWYR